MLVQLLSKTSQQIKEHCASLSSDEKQSLYGEVLNEVKNTPRNSQGNIDKLKKLSKVAVAIEETIDSKLLKKFNDGHPLREVNIAIYAPEEAKNYLFSFSDSSKLYDLKENREKAIYQAVKSNDRELVKHLLMVLVSDEIEIEFFKELEMLLSGAYEELKENLSQDMKNYLEKNISLKRFVCSNVDVLVAKPVDVQAMINLFIVQSGANYKIDELLLIKIAESLEEGELLSQINQMIELLRKQERFMELEYKVRRLLIEERANINARDDMGETALHVAAFGGKVKNVKALIEKGAEVNAESNNKAVPLHLACLMRKIRTTEVLIDAGGNIEAVDKYGCSPLNYAKMYRKVTSFLEKKGINMRDVEVMYEKADEAIIEIMKRSSKHLVGKVINIEEIEKFLIKECSRLKRFKEVNSEQDY